MNGRTGALVPAGWAAYNGLGLAILAGFGGHAIELWLYGGGCALTVLFAGALRVSRLRHPGEPGPKPLPTRGDAGLFGALGVTFLGLAVVYGAWFYPLAVVLIVLSLALVRLDLRNRRGPATAVDATVSGTAPGG